MLLAVPTYSTATPAQAIAMLRRTTERFLAEAPARMADAAAAEDFILYASKYLGRAAGRVATRGDLNPAQRRAMEDVLDELCTLDSFGDTLCVEDADDRDLVEQALDDAGRILFHAEQAA